MAITQIVLDPNWMTAYETHDRINLSPIATYNPFDQSQGIMAYSATTFAFGSIVHYGDLLSRAIQNGTNVNVNLRYNQNGNSSYYRYADLNTVRMTSPPTSTFNIGVFGEASFSFDLPIQSGGNNKEINITSMRSELSNATGIVFTHQSNIETYGGEIRYPRIVLTGNWTPNSPTLETPVGGLLIDRTKSFTFRWVHNGIFTQSKAEMRFRLAGSSSWQTTNISGSAQSSTVPPSGLPAGQYEWQVRTIMEYGGNEATGPWSGTQVFNLTNETNAPTIQSPSNGQTLPTKNLTVRWASVPNQTQINIELMRNGQRVNQVTRTQTGNSITLNGWLDNNQSYIVRLRVLASGQLWSDWAEVNFNVSYTQPGMPILMVIPNQGNDLIIRINNPPPTGTQPSPVRQDLFKREIGGSWIKLANLLPNSDYVDYAVASGKQYEYRVTVYANNDTSITSNSSRGSVTIDYTTINLANEPSVFIKLEHVRERSKLSELNAIRKQFAGRRFPVTEFGETIENNIEIESLIESHSDYIYLTNMINRQETLIYRDARGRKIYATVGGLTVVDESLGRYSVAMAFSQVDYKEGID